MNWFAILIFGAWILFVLAFVAVRTAFPNEGRGSHKVKRKEKYDDYGFDKNGWSSLGFHRNGTRYDDNGLDRYGNPKPAGERTDLKAFEPVEPPTEPLEEEE